ncbi:EAL domain-containing protein [Acidihalobacter ferrooxydans]|uniref:Diguanylate cyclase DosC n=1 Tax=Acidihalobacter ferrooxydans TaxID=1765967 RepID=A0A1P8UHV8_9GAMM|nr:EAL domain-containing protein [Acidihalobacter ferrooxydans]APZ43407.1 hypothetical protein BW247_10140 [Acidihalobacter ferrooxydans]
MDQTDLKILLQRMMELQDLLAQVNQAAVQTHDETQFLQTACDLAVERGKLILAVVAKPQADGWFAFPAAAGRTDHLERLRISTEAELPEGQGTVGRAWREGTRFYNIDCNSAELAPWREYAQAQGLRASAALPLMRQGERYAVLLLWRGDDVVFNPEMQALLGELAMDISRGLDAIGERQLREALLANTAAAILVVRERHIYRFNAQLGLLIGRSDAELSGQSTRILFSSDAEYQRVGAAYETLHAQGHVTVHSVSYRNRNGDDLLLDLHGQRLDDTTTVWTLIDVTQRARLQALYRSLMHEGSILLQAQSEVEMLEKTCHALTQGTAFHTVWIAKPDAQNQLRALAVAGAGQTALERTTLNLNDLTHAPLTVRAWRSQEVVFDNARDNDPRLGELQELFRAHCWHSVLSAPVARGGEPWALLTFASPERGVFDEDTVAACKRIAELLGHGLDELDLRQRLVEQERGEAHRARHDALTGLPNRIALNEYLPQAIARARRLETVFAVGLIDLDGFKAVNDRWGHATGDELLGQLAERLRQVLRQSDYLARLGGDEFVVVFEHLDELQITSQLRGALEHLHTAVETPFELSSGDSAQIDMSMGLAQFPLHAEEPDTLLREADAAMYQVKRGDHAHRHWWRLGVHRTPPTDLADDETAFDAYGTRAAALLERARIRLEAVTTEFVDTWYAEMEADSSAAAILQTLDAGELPTLKTRQTAHLHFLLAPETSAQAITEVGIRLGRVHAQAGVTTDLLIEFMERYEALLRQAWIEAVARKGERSLLNEILAARLNTNLRAQLRGCDAVLSALHTCIARPVPTPSAQRQWIDTARDELSALAGLPGIKVTALLQPDDQGVFRFILIEGQHADTYVRWVHTRNMSPRLDPSSPYGQGNLVRAWQSGRIEIVPALRLDPCQQPWLELFEQLRLRSEAAVPLQDSAGNTEAIVLLVGASPNQFAAPWFRQILQTVQYRWSALWQSRLRQHTPVIAHELADTRRAALFGGGLSMWVQPIISLRTGRIAKVEALARLRMPDGAWVSPDGFLPLLGERDLRWLFSEGLQQSLQIVRQWESAGLRLDLSLNLPPAILHDPKVPEMIDAHLQAAGMPAQRLMLELLESQDLESTTPAILIQLAASGIKLAIDDLGAGYSSLVRLRSLPVSTFKIDQGLVRDAAADPLRAVSLIQALIGLGGDLDQDIIVEGLENDALIEMAAILGADYGQGYGLASPMPAAELPAWTRSFRHATTPQTLNTPLGALAHHLHYEKNRHTEYLVPLASCPLGAFIERRGLRSNALGQAHDALHAGEDIERSSHRIIAELVELIRQDDSQANT